MNDVSVSRRSLLLHAGRTALVLAVLNISHPTAFAQGTAFSYQGRLNVNGIPANGSYDMTFALFGSSNGVGQVGYVLTNLNTGMSNGLFAVTLDFGPGIFTGANVWLQIGVRTNGATAFTPLAPLQPISPVPYAMMANGASNLLGTLAAAQLTGKVPVAQLPAAVVTNGASRVTLTGTFSGNGAGLTNTEAASLGANALALAQANNVYGKEAYMSWASATNGPWPTDWISTSRNHFEIPVNNINADVVTNGTFEIPTGVITTDGFGRTNAGSGIQTIVACVDAPPYDAIGADLYYDTLSGTNWPSYLFTMVSSTNVMIQNGYESTAGLFLHMHVWVTGLGTGPLANIYSSIEFETNFSSGHVYMNYQTNIYVPDPLVYTFATNYSSLHNVEIRRTSPIELQVVLDGTIIQTIDDPNLPSFWGNGTAWWEIACGGGGSGPPTADTARIRILDCYTRGLPSSPVNLYPLVIGSGLPASVEISSVNNTATVGMTNGQNVLTFSAETNSLTGSTNLLNSVALGNGGIVLSNVYAPDTNIIFGSGFVYLSAANKTFTNAFNNSYIANGNPNIIITNSGIYYIVTNTIAGRGAYNTNGFTSPSWFTNGVPVPGITVYGIQTNQFVFIFSNAAPYPPSLTNRFALNVPVRNPYNARLQTWVNYGFPSNPSKMLYTNLSRGDFLDLAGSNSTNVFDFVMSPGDVALVTNLAGNPVILRSFSIPQ